MFKLFLLLISIITLSGAGSINIDTLLTQAKQSKKHLLIFLHKPQCSYCESMQLFTLADKDIEEKIKNDFIFVDIDIADSGKVIFDDFNGTKHDFAKSLGFNFYPSSVYIDKEAEVVYGQAGFKDEEKFLKILRYVKSRAYVDVSIDEFK